MKKIARSWVIYIIQCSDGTFYTGITTNLPRRIAQHNGLVSGGAKYTAYKNPVHLCYEEPAEDRSAASIREAEIKKLSRNEKIELIRKAA